MKDILVKKIVEFHPGFSKSELEAGLDMFKLKEFKARDILTPAGEITRNLYLSDKSISRCFYIDKEGKEQTLWMKPEQTFFTEFKSFTHQSASMFSLQFYEDTSAYYISRDSLLQLYQKSKDWALFGAFLTEKLHVTLIDVFVNLLANDATQNYRYIEYAFPRFIQVAPLKDIASMLQVSQVSLSRIRSGTQLKS